MSSHKHSPAEKVRDKSAKLADTSHSDDLSHLGADGGIDQSAKREPAYKFSREAERNTSVFKDNNSLTASLTHNIDIDKNTSTNLVPDDDGNLSKTRSSFIFRKKKSDKPKEINKKRKTFWSFRLKNKRKGHNQDVPEPRAPPDVSPCVCTGYRRTESDGLDDEVMAHSREFFQRLARNEPLGWTEMMNIFLPAPVRVPFGSQSAMNMLDMTNFSSDNYPVEEIETINIRLRTREMEQGIEMSSPYPHFQAVSHRSRTDMGEWENSQGFQRLGNGNFPPGIMGNHNVINFDADLSVAGLTNALQNHSITSSASMYPPTYPTPLPLLSQNTIPTNVYAQQEETCNEYQSSGSSYIPYPVHTQIDYIHCLVPDLKNIVNCSFYWGVMDRYEAEKLLESRPEGTFLLRDSAQEEFLFSVSFRRYGRSLHARIEQWNHKFSFDSHDPGVYASDTVCELIEHYKDPSCCMFFEPMLTIPLKRNFPFSLQQLCRGVICNKTTYDTLNHLPLPKSLKKYLKFYHYKQKVCVRRFDK